MSVQSERKPFVSIKWKYLLLFSLLLLIVNGGLSWQSTIALKNQFNHHLQFNNEQTQIQLLSIIQQNNELLIQIAYNSQQFILDADTNVIDEQRKNNFIENNNLETLLLLPSIDSHQKENISNKLPTHFEQLLKDVYSTEENKTGIFCHQQCFLFVMVPILLSDNSTNTIFLSQSIANLMQNFQRMVNRDIAIINPSTQTIYALTNNPKISPAIRWIIENHPDDERVHQITWNNHTYIIQHIDQLKMSKDTEIIIISDISKDLININKAIKNSAVYGLIGLILSSIILLFFLNKPIIRLLNLSRNLPLLAQNKYNEFEKVVPILKGQQFIDDEIFALERTALQLSDQLQSSAKDLIWQAEHDALTGLINRYRFQLDFTKILRNTIRFKHCGALLYFDLDQFKYVNDSSGHHTGDTLLKLIAKQINKIIRETDLFARLGGDEFAIVLPETNEHGAEIMAAKIQEVLSEITLPTEDYVHKTSASIGLVMFPQHGDNIEELISNGDIAMYNAKDNGRGNTYLFVESDGTKENIHRRLVWKEILENALKEKKLVLYFQPILDIEKNTVSHHEALLRLINDNGDVIPPGSFIPEAEQTTLIKDIDFYVLHLAIRFLSDSNNQNSKLAVNLSGKTIDDNRLVPYIIDLLSDYQVAPERLILEITETAAVADIFIASKIMREINAIGCQFALDDFGIGFSSFYYLKQFPVEYVKIDGAFIRNMKDNIEDQLFVKAITTVISGLNKKTVAEFVEDKQTLSLLKEYGVNYAQGYHIGKPQPQPLQTSPN